MFKILFLGDIVGKPGRKAVQEHLPALKLEHQPDLVIANGENAAGGVGIEIKLAEEIFQYGVEIITTGNHIWNRKEIFPYLETNAQRIIRPGNFPEGAPGKGFCIVEKEGLKIAIVNAQGRVFMAELVECPFKYLDKLLENELKTCDLIFVDFHAEATSEKVAFGNYLDGRASVVVGTHTHVQTADERILPKGTAYISDVGMCGPRDSVIGAETEKIIKRFITGIPHKFDVADDRGMINGVLVSFDSATKKALKIERVFKYSSH